MIVVGGSLGGSAALREILQRLPAGFTLPIAVALHRHREGDELLAAMLQRGCALPVTEAEDKEPFVGGRVYVAPANYHLMIDADTCSLSTDEVVNFARPSVDVLFESAADSRETGLVAVVLSGSGSDGARGARRVEANGGTVLIQDPLKAEAPWMPRAAMASTKAARILDLAGLAEALIALGSPTSQL
jgi:two-component system chemotaxis response regulator CheB